MWAKTQSCPKMLFLETSDQHLFYNLKTRPFQYPRKTINLPHTNFNLELGHGLRLNTTSLMLQMYIGVSSRQFLQPTTIELFSIANESISLKQLQYVIIYKSLNYFIIMCQDMDHLKSSKHHIIIHP